MKNNFLFVAIFAVALATPLPVAASAQEPASHPGHGSRGGAPDSPARSTREWTRLPLIAPVMGGRGVQRLGVKNIGVTTLDVYAPDGPSETRHRQVELGVDGAYVEPVSAQNGNYYWVSAREEQDQRVTVAATAVYFSNPGAAPTRMLLERRNELEIIPQPLPREHGSYRESEKWIFLLRYNGQPLTNHEVKLETEFGSKSAFTSDAEGRVTVLFPYDFKAEEPAKADGRHRGPRRARFVLAAQHEAEGRQYLSAFNYTYSPDATRGRSLGAGMGFLALGMALAVPLWRRKRES